MINKGIYSTGADAFRLVLQKRVCLILKPLKFLRLVDRRSSPKVASISLRSELGLPPGALDHIPKSVRVNRSV